MSAPNAGRQSPDPSKQSDKQQPGVLGSGKAGAAPSDDFAKDKSDVAKHDVLESNPKGPLEDAAKEKVSKG
ncbi:MAG: hypothetical protein M1835_002497 [Candelina submexicana]|nr:MAG: hypothetical protein M1835_002497 [Candelina submexicana]